MAGSSDTEPSQHFELLPTFRSALACKDFTTNNSETLRQIILKVTAVTQGGKIKDSMSGWAVWSVVEQCAKQIGIERFGAHDLRRTCAKLCRKNGGGLEQIKFLLGHSSIQTTERYLGSEQEIEIAVNDSLGL
jgi:integrase